MGGILFNGCLFEVDVFKDNPMKQSILRLRISRLFFVMMALILFCGDVGWAANPSSGLRVEISAAPNFVVDSNVGTPASYAPRAAYIGATFYNDGTNSLTDVFANIGKYNGGVGSTPGVYDAKVNPNTAGTTLTGTFALTHEGGSGGVADATRYLGTLTPGQSVTVYWLVSYPVMDQSPTPKPVFGSNSTSDDDLSLNYDVWASAVRAGSPLTANQQKTATLRSEISAMANKIFPNSANKVPVEYQELLQKYAPQWDTAKADGSPGTSITMEGVWYDMGVVNGGYDANGDLVPDNDLWMQPVGDASLFDAGCMRLSQTFTLLIVKLKTGGDLVLTDTDKLYYTDLPENNGVVGYVRYDFLPLSAPCSMQLTPYQEAASGKNNEKFNGDYGSGGVPPVSTTTSAVTMAKSSSLSVADPGQTNFYAIAYTNSGTNTLGDPLGGMPLVISDRIPTGVTYVAGSAAISNVPAGATNYTILYSVNGGSTWTNGEPAAATNVTDLQWWLNDVLATGATGVVRFQARVRSPYNFSPVIINTGKLSFGSSAAFLESSVSTRVTGTNQLGDTVYLDNGAGGGYFGNKIQEGGEQGISNVLVSLYWDANTNGIQDVGDVLLRTASTATNGYYMFTNLPDAAYVAVVSTTSNIPAGYTITTPSYFGANLDATNGIAGTVSYTNADFGFAPALVTSKSLTSTTNMVEGRTVSYSLVVSNALPGTGTGVGTNRVYTTWASVLNSADTAWTSPSNIVNASEPNSTYSTNTIAASGTDVLVVRDFSRGLPYGSNVNVKLVMPILVSLNTRADLIKVEIRATPAATAFYTTNLYATNLVSGVLTLDVTSATNNWSILSSTNLSVALSTTKDPPGGTVLQLDAIGFRATTDQIEGAGSSTTTLDPVPMMDTFNASFLQFLSASVTPTTVSTNTGTFPNKVGTLYWDNLGPLYPGGSQQVTVNFKALEPFNGTSNTAAVVTNIQYVTNATFTSGALAGSFINQVTNTLQPAGSIGDFIYRDVSPLGAPGAGDSGIPYVQVVLTPPTGVDAGSGAGVAITNTTDLTGYYLFEGLTVSTNYRINVLTNTMPGGGSNTYREVGTTLSQTIVSNSFMNPLSTNGVSDKWRTADFGYALPSSIWGTIWWDFNQSSNATPDPGELWLTNVMVILYTNSVTPTPVATNYSDVNGYFSFNGSYTGSYKVVVIPTTGMMTNSTWGQTYDSDGLVSASTVTVSLVSGSSTNAFFSYTKTGAFTLGDTVYYDWNGNGTQNTNDEGIAEIPVYLYFDANSNGVVNSGVDPYIGSYTTLSNGYYLFSGLATGNYIVVVDSANSNFPNQVICTADPVPPTNGISYLYLTASNTNQDFGYKPYGSGSIGDTVWRDLNGDGSQLGGAETGITNVPVFLYVDANRDGTYVLLASTNTGSSGQYLFSSLPDAPYRVVVGSTSSNIPKDSLGITYGATTPVSRDITITNGISVLTADFGFAPFGAIGDTIFWDVNGNGLQDAFETGVSGVVVTLYYDRNTNGVYDGGDSLANSSLTSSNGVYLFSGLSTGRYVVVVSTNGVLANTVMTADPEADGVPVSQVTNAVAKDALTGVRINYGTFFMGADFGFQPPGAIGDLVWIDSNTNGVYDAGEVGIPNVPVVVYSNSVALATNRTDSQGNYGFGNLLDGTYVVRVLTNDAAFPAGLAAVYDPDGAADSQISSIVVSNGLVVSVGGTSRTNFDLSIDFGYKYSGANTLSGTVGLDATPYDGVLGSSGSGVGTGEAPFAGVAVYAYVWRDSDSNGVVNAGETIALGSTTTATNGDYSFTGLPSSLGGGTNYYIVSLAAPQADLKITTTNGTTSALWIKETTNLVGDTLSAYQVLAIAATITNIDFAFKSTLLLDYGDLPSIYGTLLTDVPDGARHIVNTSSPSLYLGTGVNVEANGNPTVDASGDTLDDGVTTSGVWSNGTNGASISVQVGKGAGWLVGFVDFGQKGDFLGANDMVYTNSVTTNGGNGSGLYTFSVDVPTNAISATTTTVLYARFRLFPTKPLIPELAFSGLADNGEVEDYRWLLGSVAGTVWYDDNTNGVVNGTPDYGLSNVTVYVDLNGDGIRDPAEPMAITDTNGAYAIGGLPGGSYTIRVSTNTLPAGLFAFYDVDGARDNRSGVTLVAGQVNATNNFGYFNTFISPPATVASFSLAKTLISPTNHPPAVGEQQIFTIAITNTGTAVLDTVPLTDAFNTNRVSFVSASPVPDVTNATSLVWSNLGSLAVGAQSVVTTRFNVVSGGLGTNTVWAVPATNGVPIPSLTNSVPYTNIAPSMAISKTASLNVVTSGTVVAYGYAVTNTGDTALTNVVVTDDKLGAIGTVSLLLSGASTNLSFSTNIYFDVTNTATVVAQPAGTNGVPISGLQPLTNAAQASVDVVAPGYTVVKVLTTPTNRPAIAGESMTFTISVANTGDVTLVEVPVKDIFNNVHQTYLSALPVPDSTTVNSLVWTNLGPLTAGSSTNLTVVFTAKGYTAGFDTNVVVVTPTTPTNMPAVSPETNSSPYQIDNVATISGSVWRDINGDSVVDTEDTNGIAGVQVVLTTTNGVPVATNFTDATGSFSFTNLVPGAYLVVETDLAGYVSTTPNTQAVQGDSGVENITYFLDTLAVGPAITVVKTAGTTPEGGIRYILPGTPVTYTYAVSNSGGCWLGPVTVNDNKLGLIGTIAFLPVGASTNIELTTNIFLDVTNVAVSVGTPVETNGVPLGYPDVAATNDAVVDVVSPGFTVVKTLVAPTNRPAIAGEPMTFTITVANTGDVTLVEVQVKDIFDTLNQIYFSALPVPDSTNSNSLVWTNLGPLTAGSSTNLTVIFTAKSYTAGFDTNVVVVTPTTPTNMPPVSPVTNGAPYKIDNVAQISGSVRRDIDGLGDLFDPANSNGIAGVQIVLSTTNGVPVATNFTDAFGGYSFTNLVPGTYLVVETDPVGYVSTSTNIWDVAMSSGDILSGYDFLDTLATAPAITVVKTAGTTPEGGIHYVLADTPVTYTYAVSNSGGCWLGSVTVNDNKLGLIGTITLFPMGASTNIQLTTNIFLDVTNLAVAAGTPVETNSVPLGYPDVAATNDAIVDVVAPGFTVVKTLVAPTNRPAVIGEQLTFSITVANTGDVTLVTIPVSDVFDPSLLSFASATPAPDQTNASSLVWNNVGSLVAGASTNLTVVFNAVAFTTPLFGTNMVTTAPITPTDNPAVPPATNSVPYPIDAPAIIGGFVLLDHNSNGTKDLADTNGIASVQVVLFNTNGVALATNTTGVSGGYVFSNLVPGIYGVVETDLPAYDSTTTNALLVPVTSGENSASNNFLDVQGAGIRLVKRAGNAAEGSVKYVIAPADVGYRYEVINIGGTYLGSLVVTDNVLGVVANFAGPMAPGATNTFYATNLAVSVNVTNIAVVTAMPVSGGGVPLGSPAVSSTNDAVVHVLHPPLVKLIKTAEQAPDGSLLYVWRGTNVVYTYAVINCGDAYLTNLVVTDDVLGPVGSISGTMAPGVTNYLYATNVTVTNFVVNIGVVSGQVALADGSIVPDFAPVTDTDTAVVDPVTPEIRLTKLAGNANDGEIEYVTSGSNVVYTYRVINTGSAVLTNVVVDDDILGNVTNVAILGVGETNTYTLTAINVTNSVVNHAVAVGWPTNVVGSVTDDHYAYVEVVAPQVELIKTAGSAPDGGVDYALSNQMVTFTYTVINRGDTYLSSMTVTDDVLGAIGGIEGPVAPGETNRLYKTAVSASVTNIGTCIAKVTFNDGVQIPHIGNVSDSDDAIVQVVNPSIGLLKTASSAFVTNGQPVTYTFAVTNSGDVALTNVTVNDQTFGVSWSLGTIGVGGWTNVTFSTNLTADTTNTAIAVGQPAEPGIGPVTNTALAAVDVVHPSIGLLKTASSAFVTNGQPVTYTFAVTNSGDVALTNVTVNDQTFGVSWNLGTIGVSGWTNLTFSTNLTADTTNTAVAAGQPAEPGIGPVTNTAQASVDVVHPAIQVVKTASSAYVTSGQPVTYTVTVTNIGDVAFTNVAVNDTTYGLSWAFGPLAAGAGTNLLFTTNVTMDVTNVAVAVGQPGEPGIGPVTNSDDAVVDVVAPGVVVTKTLVSPSGRPAAVGETVTFAIAVTNTGDVVLNTVPVTDTFNTNLLSFASATPAANSVIGPVATWSDVGPLAVGGSTVITARFTAVSSGSGANTAITAPTTTNGVPVPPSTNSVPHSAVNPGYVLTKTLISPTNRPPIPGETLTFGITLANTGEVALVTVPVTDVFNTNNLSFMSASPAAVVVGGTVIWTNVGSVAQASSTNLTVTFAAIAATSPAVDTNGVTAAPVTATNHPPVPAATNGATYRIDAPAVIGGWMWWDLDTNGVINAGEASLTNNLVTLRDSTNGVVATTRTGTNGVYAFTNLVPGTYTVGFSYTNGWYFSPTNGTNNAALDSDANPMTGITPPVTVASGATNMTLNAGVFVVGSLGQYVWVDVDRNTMINENLYKYGLNGVRVSLFRIVGASNIFAGTAITAPQIVGSVTNNGYFNFTNLPFGLYKVAVSNGVPPNLTDPTTPSQYIISLGYQAIVLHANFGYMYAATPVELKSFTAAYDGMGVDVQWETGVELENLGFNLYRSTSFDGDRVKLNGNLIPGMGNSQGQAYEWRDSVPDTKTTYYYWLEDVSWKFETKTHGPALLRGTDLGVQGAIGNFEVPAGGLCRISYAVMKSSGLPVNMLDPAQLQVLVGRQEVPIYVSTTQPLLGEGDYILFNTPEAGLAQECTVALGTNVMRMALIQARPSRVVGDVRVDLADKGQTVGFLVATNYVRYLIADFIKTPVWVLDVTKPQQAKLLYGFSYIQATNGLSAVYLSYPGVSSARCTAVGDQAVYDVPVIRKSE